VLEPDPVGTLLAFADGTDEGAEEAEEAAWAQPPAPAQAGVLALAGEGQRAVNLHSPQFDAVRDGTYGRLETRCGT
jgi:hypothetical protein